MNRVYIIPGSGRITHTTATKATYLKLKEL